MAPGTQGIMAEKNNLRTFLGSGALSGKMLEIIKLMLILGQVWFSKG